MIASITEARKSQQSCFLSLEITEKARGAKKKWAGPAVTRELSQHIQYALTRTHGTIKSVIFKI